MNKNRFFCLTFHIINNIVRPVVSICYHEGTGSVRVVHRIMFIHINVPSNTIYKCNVINEANLLKTDR